MRQIENLRAMNRVLRFSCTPQKATRTETKGLTQIALNYIRLYITRHEYRQIRSYGFT